MGICFGKFSFNTKGNKIDIFYRKFLANVLSLALAKVKFILIITDMKATTSPSVAQCESLGKSPALLPLDVRLQYLLRVNFLNIPYKFTYVAVAPYFFNSEVEHNTSITN